MEVFKVVIIFVIFSILANWGISIWHKKSLVEYGDYTKFVKSETVIIYGSEWCEFCNKTKEFLSGEGVKYTFIDVEKNLEDKSDFKELGGTSYPLIVTKSFLIKGYNEEVLIEKLIISSD